MSPAHVVVDGSNLATEGRSVPSLDQLEQAVQELKRELPDALLTVVVDATFAHRIDPSERERFERAALAGEYVSPPAGAVGRGDAFLLRIAEKVGATVVSNDSFQEFHGEHPWLFEAGRLIGATPVPGVGWIFMPRSPVRGPRSRQALREVERSSAKVKRAIKAATDEATKPVNNDALGEKVAATYQQAVNDPLQFITFIAEHRLGELIDAEVESFASHGAIALCGDVHCYVPLSGLGNPPPNSARAVLKKGETRPFTITALDPHRRGVELALPEVAVVSGHPREETIAAELKLARKKVSASSGTKPSPRRAAPTDGAKAPSRPAKAPSRPAKAPSRPAKAASRESGNPDDKVEVGPGAPRRTRRGGSGEQDDIAGLEKTPARARKRPQKLPVKDAS